MPPEGGRKRRDGKKYTVERVEVLNERVSTKIDSRV